MKSIIASAFALALLSTPLAAQTMTVLLPTLTYPETVTVPSDPDRPGYPETGPVTSPTVAASTKDCDPAAPRSVCVAKGPMD
jgi:hypothetical protein